MANSHETPGKQPDSKTSGSHYSPDWHNPFAGPEGSKIRVMRGGGWTFEDPIEGSQIIPEKHRSLLSRVRERLHLKSRGKSSK